MNSLKIFFLLCAFLFLEATARKKKKECCDCPPLVPPGDFDDPAVIRNLTSNTVSQLWANPEPPLTKNVKKLSKVLIKFAKSKNTYWQSTASVATLWSWTFLPQLNSTKPSLCAFANVIDGTVKWLRTDKCKFLEEPLRTIGRSTADGSRLAATTALSNSKCSKAPGTCDECKFDLAQPTDSTINASCCKNGTVYNIKKYIKEIKPYYPEKYLCLLEEMYKSCDYQDNLIAAIVLASASPPFQSLIDGFDNKIKYQLFYLQSTAELPPCCCKDFCKALKANLGQIGDEGSRTADATLKEICC